jgi:hypothetical protein
MRSMIRFCFDRFGKLHFLYEVNFNGRKRAYSPGTEFELRGQ